MSEARRLEPVELRTPCDPAALTFQTTADLADLEEVLGQPRATEAIRFGIGIRRPGFNVFALGESGTGRREVIESFLRKRVDAEATPADWCYVHNFSEPRKPSALRLPAGVGLRLRERMQQLVEDVVAAIPAAFESEEYRRRRKQMEEEAQAEHKKPLEELGERAEKRNIVLLNTPHGMALAPVRDGAVLNPEAFNKLPDEEKERIQADLKALEAELEHIVEQVPRWQRRLRHRIREFDRNITRDAVHGLIEDLRPEFRGLPEVLSYLDAVEKDVVANAKDFLRTGAEEEGAPAPTAGRDHDSLQRYEINVLVANDPEAGAPVVYEDNPTFQNLMGAVEYVAQMGTLLTDFTLIKAGALHRANGGYLLVDARRLFMQPFAWEGLKRALRSGTLRAESPGQAFSLVNTVSLEPEAVPLEVKVILLGERPLYYLLCQYDPEFRQLFKVAADFEASMPRDDGSAASYGRLIATLARRDGLLPLDRGACARLVEEGARLAADAERVSIRRQDLTDLMQEADHWARESDRTVIGVEDVVQAVERRIYRADRLRERLQEETARGTLLIDTGGERVAQINGLSIHQLGDFAFGHPSRITARVRLGRGEVVDIQREVELGGPIHSKGVLTLAGYLGQQYAPDMPHPLSASLVFEQAYGPVDGDSASAAELFALLSALSGAPLIQSLAVTGSVNQHGDIQAIGGVNEKIEGFFDVCRRGGLTGRQGVLIPAANVKHLMLRTDVVQAVERGEFHVYEYRSVDEGLALLTDLPAGTRGADGNYPESSVNGRVEARLLSMNDRARAFAAPASGESSATPPAGTNP